MFKVHTDMEEWWSSVWCLW